MDYCGSLGYNTSRALAELSGPLVGKTYCHLQNPKDLADCWTSVMAEEGDVFVSHDVVSLFTNTLIDESLDIIRNRLRQDITSKDRTKLEVDDVMDLLRFILSTRYFQFNDVIYRQKLGTAMASLVSPIIAYLFMEFLEQRAIVTAPMDINQKLWKCYVDDILEPVRKDKFDALTEHLNQVDDTDSIKFSDAWEKDSQLVYLDVLLVRKEDENFKLLVYCKPSHTDQYLSFNSHHPLHQKLGGV